MAVDQAILRRELAGLDALEQVTDAPKTRWRRVRSSVVPKLIAAAIAVGIWQLVVASGWKRTYVFPGPDRVFMELRDQLSDATFWRAVGVTMRRALAGYSVAVLVGILIGAPVARIRPLRKAVGSLITGLQTMPSIVWFPFAILLFGLSESAILFVVVLGAAPSIATGLISGVDHVPPILLRAGRMLGARGIALSRHVVLPAALPSCLSGLKQGWAFAWRSLMAGELLVILARRPSIGARLSFAREFSDAPALLALMVVVLAIGLVVDAAFGAADTALRRRWGLVDLGT